MILFQNPPCPGASLPLPTFRHMASFPPAFFPLPSPLLPSAYMATSTVSTTDVSTAGLGEAVNTVCSEFSCSLFPPWSYLNRSRYKISRCASPGRHKGWGMKTEMLVFSTGHSGFERKDLVLRVLSPEPTTQWVRPSPLSLRTLGRCHSLTTKAEKV